MIEAYSRAKRAPIGDFETFRQLAREELRLRGTIAHECWHQDQNLRFPKSASQSARAVELLGLDEEPYSNDLGEYAAFLFESGVLNVFKEKLFGDEQDLFNRALNCKKIMLVQEIIEENRNYRNERKSRVWEKNNFQRTPQEVDLLPEYLFLPVSSVVAVGVMAFLYSKLQIRGKTYVNR